MPSETASGGTLVVRGGELLGPEGFEGRADLLIVDGSITEVGQVGAVDGARELDASRCFVAPGLINAHYHSAENFNPGRYENLPLDLWFVHSHQVARKQPPTAEVIYARTMLGAMAVLRGGTTSVVDFLFEAPEITLESLEPVVRAYRDAGLRATILLGIADKSFGDSLPLTDQERAAWGDEFEPPGLEQTLEVGRAAVDRWHQPGGLIGIGWGPSAPQRCSPELIQETMEMARSAGLAWQTHVQETKTQAVTSRQWHGGKSFVEVLHAQGVLGPQATLVHAVWTNDRDIELMADTGTAAVHCLASNLRLGDGIAPVPAMRRAGVRVALGTDGRGCDETLDILEVARMNALVHKSRGGDHRDWITAAESFSMLTREAGAFTGHGNRLGTLEPGAHADLILIESRGNAFTPLNDPARQLIYGAGPREIRAVVIAGEIVVEGDRLTRVDEAEMLARAREAAASETSVSSRGAARLEGLIEGVY